MLAARIKLLQTLFEEALSQPHEERSTFLDERCGGDAELKAEIEALLTADACSESIDDVVVQAATSFLSNAASEPMDGMRIGAYRVVHEIGQGGMGRVYLAERDDAQYAGRVALKLLARTGASRAHEERFRTECQLLADLRHPGIASLLDAGSTETGDPYLVMEYVDGDPIDVFCDRHALSVDARLDLFRRLCDTVEHAHRNLIVHRDIKASNVLVTADGEPKLLDFGIAKLLDIDRARTLDLHETADVSRLLTPATASPEQLRGEPVTTATDVYALGHLLYRLLTGHMPYRVAAGDRFALPKAILESEPPRPSTVATRADPESGETPEELAGLRAVSPIRLAHRLSGDLDSIVLKALRKEPERRYATPRELADDITRHLEHRPVAARGDSLGYVTRRFLWRRRGAVAATAAVLVAVASLVGFYTAQLAAERDRARIQAQRAEEVSSFLSELFEVATPAESRGAEITAREMLDRGAERIGTELRGAPAVRGALMRVIGSAYGDLGLYDKASETLGEALATREALGGPPDAELGDVLHDLGIVALLQARYPDARALLERALEVRRTVHGASHGKVVETLIGLSSIEHELANFEAAGALLDEAEAMARALEPPDAVRVAEVLLARGDRLERLGDFEGAVANLTETVALRKEASGFDHPATLMAQTHLADALNSAGKTAEALDILRAAYPDDHPLTAIALNNLANIKHDLRNLESALALHEESLAMNRRLYGDDHPSLADSYNNIATLQLDREDYAGALRMFERTLDLDVRTLGQDHPFVGQDIVAIGVALGLLGRLEEAEERLRAGLAETRRTSEEAHPLIGNALRELAIVLRQRGRCDEAVTLFAEAMPLLEAAFPGDPWQTASARANYGACLGADSPEGEALLRSGYERLVTLHGQDDRLTRQARELLMDFLNATSRDAEARQLAADAGL